LKLKKAAIAVAFPVAFVSNTNNFDKDLILKA
jgi:hypothetical protein